MLLLQMKSLPFVCLFLALQLGGALGACPSGWTRYYRKCYVVIKERERWSGAQATCMALGANLASSRNSWRNTKLATIMRAARVSVAWIGLHDLDRDGQFRWVRHNRRVSYTHWGRGQPQRRNTKGTENCVFLYAYRGYYWYDYPCSTRLKFVCEKNG